MTRLLGRADDPVVGAPDDDDDEDADANEVVAAAEEAGGGGAEPAQGLGADADLAEVVQQLQQYLQQGQQVQQDLQNQGQQLGRDLQQAQQLLQDLPNHADPTEAIQLIQHLQQQLDLQNLGQPILQHLQQGQQLVRRLQNHAVPAETIQQLLQDLEQAQNLLQETQNQGQEFLQDLQSACQQSLQHLQQQRLVARQPEVESPAAHREAQSLLQVSSGGGGWEGNAKLHQDVDGEGSGPEGDECPPPSFENEDAGEGRSNPPLGLVALPSRPGGDEPDGSSPKRRKTTTEIPREM